MAPSPNLETKTTGEAVEARFTGRRVVLDETNLRKVGRQLNRLAQEVGPRTLLLTFANVEYLSSTGLATLIGLHKTMRAGGGRLVLRNINAQVYEIFRMTKLNTFLDVRPEEPGDAPSPEGGPPIHPDAVVTPRGEGEDASGVARPAPFAPWRGGLP